MRLRRRRASRPAPVPGRAAAAIAYFAAEAVAGIRRNGLMSAAAVTTVMVVLLTIGASILVGANLTHIAGSLEADVQIVAFLADSQPPEAVAVLRRRAAEVPGVATVRFVPRDEALGRLRRSLGNGAVPANLDANPLPDSLEIRVSDAQRSAAVAEALRGLAGIDEVTYGAQVVDRLLALTRGVRVLTAVAGVLLGAVAIIVVVNTIHLTVIARRQEIEIMGLVGATRWFIRWPFLIEGMLQGILAAGVSAVLLAGGYAVASTRLLTSLPFLPMLPARHLVGMLAGTLLLIGVGVGTAGSAIAVRRFLTA